MARTTSPRSDGLSMPARWTPHARTFVSWPARLGIWGSHLDEAKREYATVVRAISAFEPVTVVANVGAGDEARALCGDEGVEIAELAIDDSWIRDNGPMFVVNGRGGTAMVDFGFNAWGGKFPTYDNDAALPRRLGERMGMRRYEAPLVAEGGGITVDGEGTLITTESVLLNPNRNPGMGREDVEEVLRDYLGVEKVIWLPFGLAEDTGPNGTDGHSDNVVQFVRPGVVLFQAAPHRDNPNWDLAHENRARLARATDAAGRALEIVEMPYLPSTHEIDGCRHAVSYTNFYPVNRAVIAPQLEIPEDDKAFAILEELFPNRAVVGVPAVMQAYGGGGVGCITQQQPAGTPLPPR